MDAQKDLGPIVRRLRLAKGLTLDNVAVDLGISKAFLSYAENGKMLLKNDVFDQFLNRYRIGFNNDLSMIGKIKNILDNLVRALIYSNSEREDEIINEVMLNKNDFESSFACAYLPLVECVLTVHNLSGQTIQEQSHSISEAEAFLPLYSADERALFTFAKAYSMDARAKYGLAVKLYYEALEMFDGRQWPQLEGIIKMNLSNALVVVASYFDAYEMVREARDIFIKNGNYNRAMICENNISNCLLTMQCFEAAQKTLQKILMMKESFSNLKVYIHSTRTMLLALTLDEKFTETIQFGEKHKLPFENGFIGNYCLIPYCYYRIGQPEESLREIKELSKEKPAADDKAFFSLLKAIIKKDKTGIEKEKLRMEKICSKQLNWLMLMVLYQLMIYYYTSEKEYELLADAYAKQAMVLKHKLPLPKE